MSLLFASLYSQPLVSSHSTPLAVSTVDQAINTITTRIKSTLTASPLPILTDPSLTLIYSNTQRNPLAHRPLFKDYLDKFIESQISFSPIQDILNFHKIRIEEEPVSQICTESYLQFSSDFECGNLQSAFHYKNHEFILTLRPDHGNTKYSHWFFFEVSNKTPCKVTFHIVNIHKKDVSLMKGMKIVVKTEGEWQRGGEEINFRETLEPSSPSDPGCYTLSFTYTFLNQEPVSFAYSYPYSYSKLSDFLKKAKHHHHSICNVSTLCKTLAGNACEMITITNEMSSYLDLKKNQISEKKAIFFMGRVHPDESPASYIIQGLICFLLGKSYEAKALRKNFVFKIVPMLNPDGVIYGNSRCSLLGTDLNRRWAEANQVLHPEIFATKELIKATKDMHEVVMYCDIHSHAKKRNVFMYGCSAAPTEKIIKKRNLVAKLIPILLAKKNTNFSYEDGHFKMEKDKESTGRIVVYKEFGVVNSYTLETSFFGKDNNECFKISDWEIFGSDLAMVCMSLVSPITVQSSLRVALDWHKKQKRSKLKPKSKSKGKKINKGRVSSENLGDYIELLNDEKLPNIQSPELKLIKVASLCSIGSNERIRGSYKKNKSGKSQRNSKISLDLASSRKIMGVFPSLEHSSDIKKKEASKKLTIISVKIKDSDKLPLIKNNF